MTATDGEGPEGIVRRFLDAVVWGEHLVVWELLGASVRARLLRIAVDRGMDEALAARLRAGTAALRERDLFLADLVNGLRADLDGCDLDTLETRPDPLTASGTTTPHVQVVSALPLPLGDLPVGSYELVVQDGKWRIDAVHVVRSTR
ncbi:MAG: hypothetical protein NVS3B12_14980 [Acidimicrobiales bacterium]